MSYGDINKNKNPRNDLDVSPHSSITTYDIAIYYHDWIISEELPHRFTFKIHTETRVMQFDYFLMSPTNTDIWQLQSFKVKRCPAAMDGL